MRGKVVFAEIRLDLDDFADALAVGGAMDEKFAEQFPRDDLRVAVVEMAREFLHGRETVAIPGLTEGKMSAK
jgi:hypothetical protein